MLLAYLGVAECGFVWDDDDYVTQNPVLRSAAGLWSIWFEPRSLPQYYPLVHTTFWVEWQLWGAAPLGYHVVNVLLHGLAALLFGRLLQRLAVPGAWAAALWFAAHPLHVESVAWVTERKNVLSLVAALCAAHRYWSWHTAAGADARATRRHLLLAGVWFALALASKTVTATLPAALLVVVWWRDGRIARRDAWPLGAALAGGALAAGATAWLEAVHVGAADTSDLAYLDRLLVAGRAPWHYLGSVLWPFGNCFHYPRWRLDPGDWTQWLYVVATLAALTAAGALRPRWGRGPLATLLLFGGVLTPVLGCFDVYPFRFSFVADHFAYHASLPVFAAVAAVTTRWLAGRWPGGGRLAALAIAVGLALLSSRLVPNYRDEATLWQATLHCNPASTLALTNLAGRALAAGDLATAQALSERALRSDPDHPESIANLGVLAHRRNDLAAAEAHYLRALALRPRFATTLRNLGALRHQQGRSAEARPLVEQALALDPEYLDGRTLHVTVLHALRDWRACLDAADWVLAHRPDLLDMRLRAAEAALELGDRAAALAHAERALQQAPGLEQARRVIARARAGG